MEIPVSMLVIECVLFSLEACVCVLSATALLCVWMHSLTRPLHHAQGQPCFYVHGLFVYEAVRFHDGIPVIDRRWFTDNPWLCSHAGPHKEWHWLPASCVLESKLHVALDTHLFLSLLTVSLLKSSVPTERLAADLISFCWQGADMITRGAKMHFLRGALRLPQLETTISLNFIMHFSDSAVITFGLNHAFEGEFL